MHQEEVDMVAGEFNGAAGRRRSGDEQRHDSTVQELANSTWPYSMVVTRRGSRRMVRFVRFHPAIWFRNLNGIFAYTVRSTFIMNLLESNVPTRVATSRYEFISCTSTHGWLIAHLEMSNIGGQTIRKGISPHDHKLNHVAIHA